MSEWVMGGSLADFGNEVLPLKDGSVPREKLQAPDNLVDILEGPRSASALRAPVVPEEMELVDHMLTKQEDQWEMVRQWDRITIERYKDRSVFGGIFFGRFKNTITPEVCECPLDLVAYMINNYNERARLRRAQAAS